ncbi:MAG TPA: hypothetical protein ENN72_08105 [Firmicutes bacterium]|nr:hypothetical protein [Bacillota bacterium]
MRFKFFMPLLFIVMIQSLGAAPEDFDRDEKSTIISDVILYSIEKLHYGHNEIDDAFSQKLFDEFIGQVDYMKWFLTQKDTKELSRYRKKLDDMLYVGDFTFCREAFHRIDRNRALITRWIDEFLSQPLDYTLSDSFETDSKKRRFASGEKELRSIWKDVARMNVINRYLELLAEQNVDEDGLFPFDNIEFHYDPEIEKEARAKAKESLQWIVSRYDDMDDQERIYLFLNVVMNVLDPHSLYFPPKLKEDFDLEMSGTFEGIGAVLTQSEGYVKIESIVPGGPSWRNKKLEPEDIILKVGEKDRQPVDLINMPLDDAVSLIRGKKGSTVDLTVKKPDGRLMVISIERDVVIIEESYLKYTILEEPESGARYGYIYLPKFYRDFYDAGGRNSSDDMKAALMELQKKGIQGLILDLRNNGGGALEDAINVAGLFIRSGPIVQVKSRTGAPQVDYDKDKDVHYTGPMVVMINTFSASASEIVAGALQDYGRAVIVGTGQSFGKGTVQNIVDIDRIVSPLYHSLKPFGAVKVTMQKFYRVTGESNQYKGVVPDINLPGVYSKIDIGERNYENALKWDKVSSLSYEPWSLYTYDIKSLQEESRNRVSESAYFKTILREADLIKKIREESRLLLNLENEFQYRREVNKEISLLEEEYDAFENGSFIVFRNKELSRSGSSTEELYEEWLEDVESDAYIMESFHILQDMAGTP